jgi:hypothetical protein
MMMAVAAATTVVAAVVMMAVAAATTVVVVVMTGMMVMTGLVAARVVKAVRARPVKVGLRVVKQMRLAVKREEALKPMPRRLQTQAPIRRATMI